MTNDEFDMFLQEVSEGLFDDVDEAKAWHNRIREDIRPLFVEGMKQAGLIDLNRVDDKMYVDSVIRENWAVLKDRLRITPLVEDQFLAAARSAADAGQKAVVVVLLVAVIEHRLNRLLRTLISGLTSLPEKQITVAIRQSIDSKFDLLIPLVSHRSFSESLVGRILGLKTMRNSLIHFKSVSFGLEDEHMFGGIWSDVNQLDVDKLFALIAEFESSSQALLTDVLPGHAQKGVDLS